MLEPLWPSFSSGLFFAQLLPIFASIRLIIHTIVKHSSPKTQLSQPLSVQKLALATHYCLLKCVSAAQKGAHKTFRDLYMTRHTSQSLNLTHSHTEHPTPTLVCPVT